MVALSTYRGGSRLGGEYCDGGVGSRHSRTLADLRKAKHD